MFGFIRESEIERTVINEDCEVVGYQRDTEREIGKVDKSSEEPYIKLYLYHVSHFLGLPQSAMEILFGLCSHVNLIDSTWSGRRRDSKGRVIDKNEQPKCAKLYLNSELKRDVCDALGISLPTFNRRLADLCDKGILRRVGRSTYQLNPFILARGNWAEILELRSTFDYVNGTIGTEMVCRDEETGEPVRVM